MKQDKLTQLLDCLKNQGYKNYCFFLPSYTVAGGGLIALNIANHLSCFPDLNIYYYDFKGGVISSLIDLKYKVHFLEYNEKAIDFPLKEKCIIFTNSTRVILLQKMNPQNRIVLWHYETTPCSWNLVLINHEEQNYLRLLKNENALCYHDWSARDSLNRYNQLDLHNKNYVQIVIDKKNMSCCERIVHENEINIGFLSRLVPEKIQALFYLIDNFALYKTKKKKILHIIGDGRSRAVVNNYLAQFKDKINFVMTGTLTKDCLNTYLANNIDCLFGVGTCVLEAAALKLPSVVLLLNTQKIKDQDAFWLFNSKEYCVGITVQQKKSFNIKYDKISEMLDMIYKFGLKKKLGDDCFNYFLRNHTDFKCLVLNFLQICNASTLTFEKLKRCIKYIPYKMLKVKKLCFLGIPLLVSYSHIFKTKVYLLGLPVFKIITLCAKKEIFFLGIKVCKIKTKSPWSFPAVRFKDNQEIK